MSFIPFIGGIVAGSLAGGALDPLSKALGYGVNDLIPVEIPQANDLIDMHHRSGITTQQYYDLMKMHGYNQNNAKLLYYAKDAIVTPQQSVSLLIADRLDLLYAAEESTDTVSEVRKARARLTTLQNYVARQKRQGFRQSEALDVFKAERPLPTFSTILEWMAKEVFEPTVIKKFKLAEEEPEALSSYMSAFGVPSTEASKYWIAHWLTIGREAWNGWYQRFDSNRRLGNYDDIDSQELAEAGVTWDDVKITRQDYNDYYTVLELSPYFRDRGRGALYNPMPFTVLQQLWQYGVLNYRQMVGRLRDYGYSKRSSELILEAWQRKYPYGAREPLRDNIIEKFKRGKITRAEANTALSTAGVTDDARTFLLDSVEDKLAEELIVLKLRSLKSKAYQNELTEAQLTAEVNAIIPAAEPERRTWEANVIKSYVYDRTAKVSVRIVLKGYSDGTITEQELRDYMSKRYYPQTDIDLSEKAYRKDTSVRIPPV